MSNLDNVWYCDSSLMCEHALKIYHYYNELSVIVTGESFKEFLISYGYPENQIYLKDSILDSFRGYNFFSCYNTRLVNHFTNRYKIDYGMGHSSFYFNDKISFSKNEKGMLAQNEFQQLQYLQKCRNANLDLIAPVLGIAKIDDYKFTDFKKTKPIILYLHTYNKENKLEKWVGETKLRYAGFTDHVATAKVLEKFIPEFEILHKAHHCNSGEHFNKFTNFVNGEIDTVDIFEKADLIVAEYGGSAIEAMCSDAKIIYVDDDHLETLDKSNLDVKIHEDFYHCQVKDLEQTIKYVLENPFPDEMISKRLEYRKSLFPYLHNGAQKIAEFMKLHEQNIW